mmetsp:Transcript_2379/g.8951  ORF Transcript_2379/g.8951 Transcript_2379/m.8951 type:complete len:101 (+) Transcript_2379:1855-2157(+)
MSTSRKDLQQQIEYVQCREMDCCLSMRGIFTSHSLQSCAFAADSYLVLKTPFVMCLHAQRQILLSDEFHIQSQNVFHRLPKRFSTCSSLTLSAFEQATIS